MQAEGSSVTCLVVTSSVAAVWVGPHEKGKGHVFTGGVHFHFLMRP